MPRRRSLTVLPLAAAAALALAACGSSASTSTSASASGSAVTAAAACTPAHEQLHTAGQLTVGTDSPAYTPYFVNNQPDNGQGFESAVAYDVAAGLGFSKSQVKWVIVPFNSSYQPGPKDFDFDINEISITPQRATAVTFSTPYYQAPNGAITLKGNKFADATTYAELHDARFGVQVGTTALQFIQNVVKPGPQIQVFNDTASATQALQNKQIDVLVTDLPTADYIATGELNNGVVIGQFATTNADNWGLLFPKGDTLAGCADKVLAQLTSSGTLSALNAKWLTFSAVPHITAG
jgi:polar amino acid transport system substrate-binding protein